MTKYYDPKVIAKVAHKGQKYGPVDYMLHVESVVANTIKLFGCQPYITDVAYLHDTIEDCPDITVEKLLELGAPEIVVGAVVSLSKNHFNNYEEYIEELVLDRDEGNGLAWKVKVADTMSNLMASVIDDNQKRVLKYTKQLELLYGPSIT